MNTASESSNTVPYAETSKPVLSSHQKVQQPPQIFSWTNDVPELWNLVGRVKNLVLGAVEANYFTSWVVSLSVAFGK